VGGRADRRRLPEDCAADEGRGSEAAAGDGRGGGGAEAGSSGQGSSRGGSAQNFSPRFGLFLIIFEFFFPNRSATYEG
jgi:hypothetical protein